MFIKSIKEEFNNIITNKIILVVLILIPLLTTITIGIELSEEVIKDIPMAVIDYDNSTFSRQLLDSFNQNETFTICAYSNDEQELEALLANSYARMGLIIPKDFYNDIMLLKSPTIIVIYDGSHMSITSAAKAKATEILLTYKAGATIKQLSSRLNLSYEQAFNITQAFQFSNRMLYNPAKSFKDFLAPILMAGSVQAAIALTATVSVNQDLFFNERHKRLGYSTGKILFYSILGTLSFVLCILAQVFILDITFKGSLLEAFILSAVLSFSVSAFCVLISGLFKKKIIALIAGAVVFIPNSIMAGTTWPLIAMPVGYQAFAKYMPFAHYVNNLRNIYLKGIELHTVINDIIYLFFFGFATTIISEVIFMLLDCNSLKKEPKQDGLSKNIKEGITLNI